MLKAYRYRIYPTSQQKDAFNKTFGCCRMLYNLALETKVYAYKSHGVNLSFFTLGTQLTELRQEYDWLREVSQESLEKSLQSLDRAFVMFFNGAGFPKFKKKGENNSFTTRRNTSIDFDKGLLNITKIPNIPIVISRRFCGKVKTVTISKTPTEKYFASILVDDGVLAPEKAVIDRDKALGMDLGLTHFAILSDGRKFENPRHLNNSLKRLQALQIRASRKKKGSANRKKAAKSVAIQYERISNQRKDFLQKLSTSIVRDSQATTICIETLNVSNMVKNHNLARAITDASWSEFVRQLNYKCGWLGVNLIKIGTFEPSSKVCSSCRAVNIELKLSDRVWTCGCGVTHDRDVNAAINIKNIGLSGPRKSVEPVESLAVARAKKQEKKVSDTKPNSHEQGR